MSEAKCLQAEVNEGFHRLRQEEAEFGVRQKMLEPVLSAAEKDRESAQAMKREAQNQLEASEARESAVLQSEAGLRVREREAEKKFAEARLVYNKYASAKAISEADIKSISQQKSGILKERFRMHRCSVELSSQLDLLRHAVREVMKLKKTSSEFDIALAPSGEFGGDVDENRVHPLHIRNTNEINTGSDDVSAPLMLQCKSLLRNFEQMSERMHILADELQSDPFSIVPVDEIVCPNDEVLNKTLQLSAIENNNSFIDVRSGRETISSDMSRLLIDGVANRKREEHSRGHILDAPSKDIRLVVEAADNSLSALRAAAQNYGR